MSFLLVFLGGGLGAVCRFLVSKIIGQEFGGFPYATFSANVISCIILGFLMGIFVNRQEASPSALFLVTGFCGGFSTFSSFSAESYQLISNNSLWICGLYIVASVLVCLLSIIAGIKLHSLL